ncbi:MAG TPA: hypothetical protein VFX61_09335 [Micromonosporaceae bacterium]|nr:hypothetical protein [Micromonosporaceae bacterium]
MMPPSSFPDGSSGDRPMSWVERRRQKIADEIARNRRGEYTVPTWVLAALLVLIIVAWAALIILA